jgi:serine/threonine protein kinase
MSEPEAAAEPAVGTVIAQRWRLVERTALDGDTLVYRADDLKGGKPVLLKLLDARSAASRELAARFDRDARIVSRLNHGNCVPILDFGVCEARPYLVMPALVGRRLGDELGKPQLTPTRAVRIATQLLEGLRHGHAYGVVHRELGPDKILLAGSANAPDHVKIIDFGLARLRGDDKARKAANVYGCVAPEQLQARNVDQRADLYAVGVLLRAMASGQSLPAGDGAGRPLTPALQRVLARATAKDPEQRFADAGEFVDELEAIGEGRTAKRRKATVAPPPKLGRWLALAAALLVVAGGGLAWRARHARLAAAKVATVASAIADHSSSSEAASAITDTTLSKAAVAPVRSPPVLASSPPPKAASAIADHSPPHAATSVITDAPQPKPVAVAVAAPPRPKPAPVVVTSPPPPKSAPVVANLPPPKVASVIADHSPPPKGGSAIADQPPPPKVASVITDRSPPSKAVSAIADQPPSSKAASVIADATPRKAAPVVANSAKTPLTAVPTTPPPPTTPVVAEPTPAGEAARVNALIAAGNLDAAEQELRAQLDLHAEAAELHLLLGEVFFRRFWRRDAIVEWDRALTLQPSLRRDPRLTGRLCATLGARWRGAGAELIEKRFGPDAVAALRGCVASATDLERLQAAAQLAEKLGGKSAIDPQLLAKRTQELTPKAAAVP